MAEDEWRLYDLAVNMSKTSGMRAARSDQLHNIFEIGVLNNALMPCKHN